MTAKAAISKALLLGKVLNIKRGFDWFGVTNMPREIGHIERAFGIRVDRKRNEGKTRYQVHCTWTDYKLRIGKENAEGVEKMIDYVIKKEGQPKTAEVELDRRNLEHIKFYVQQLKEGVGGIKEIAIV